MRYYLPRHHFDSCGLRNATNWWCRWSRFPAHERAPCNRRGHGTETSGRRVLTSAGAIDNDALVIASGGRFIKKLPGSGIHHTVRAALRPGGDSRSATGPQHGTIAVGFAGNLNEPTAVRGGPMFEFLFVY